MKSISKVAIRWKGLCSCRDAPGHRSSARRCRNGHFRNQRPEGRHHCVRSGPASRAYLYYTDEYKTWAPGLKVNIMAR